MSAFAPLSAQRCSSSDCEPEASLWGSAALLIATVALTGAAAACFVYVHMWARYVGITVAIVFTISFLVSTVLAARKSITSAHRRRCVMRSWGFGAAVVPFYVVAIGAQLLG